MSSSSESRVPDVGASDYLRSILAPVHQDEAASVMLTLAVPAGVLNGRAVHPAVWLRRMAAEIRSRPGPPEGKDPVARIFETHAARRDDGDLPTGALMSSIHHAYLADATLTPSGVDPTSKRGTLWQVALADVSAWTIGEPA
ncbi:hypothetical protein [Pseudonocardia endophytica]|uniref:Uncharacterized protein n=1 Tax=Pseudonocardia endophytica TaxID=401976 RepID=A0A4R1HW64_PSEEN|nr:hypothetical protein [Pseudonocardia endophytica]TCK21772.1 hypothetical protein EV378_5763 [Pseudonocardia endophytica]